LTCQGVLVYLKHKQVEHRKKGRGNYGTGGGLLRSLYYRMTGVAKATILRLLAEVGKACAEYQSRVIQNVLAQRVQADEIWSFVGCKQKQVTIEKIERSGMCGDVWTYVAIDAQTKLVISWLVGRRRDCNGVPSGRCGPLGESHSVDHGWPQDVLGDRGGCVR
jgi:hypothetical protein